MLRKFTSFLKLAREWRLETGQERPRRLRAAWGSLRTDRDWQAIAGLVIVIIALTGWYQFNQGPTNFVGNVSSGVVITVNGTNCTVAGIGAAVTSVGSSGTVHAEGCSGITWGSTLTLASPVTLFMPCGNNTFSAQILNVTADDVHIHFCGDGSLGQVANYTTATGGSLWTASASSSFNAIVAMKTARGSQNSARISGFTIDGLLINMNGGTGRTIYTSSCWHCEVRQVVAYGQNCSDGAIYQEADPASDGTLFAGSYFMHMLQVVSIIQQVNTTCHPFYFDSSNGEIGYSIYEALYAEGYPQAAGSGSDSFYLVSGASNVNMSFDQDVFMNPKAQDPTTNKYGINLVGAGNYAGNSGSSFSRIGGSIFNVQFLDAQPERIFSTGGTGVGIGCTTNGTTAGGAGCAFIVNQNFSGGGWGNNEDVANLGCGYMSVSDNAATLQGPMFRQSGCHQGSNSNFERIDPSYSPTGNSQTGFSVNLVPNTANPNNYTGADLQGLAVDMADGTHTGGTFGSAEAIKLNCFAMSWATTAICLDQVGGAGNHLDSWLEIGTASVGNPGGLANAGRLWYDQANQQLDVLNNNSSIGFQPIAQRGTLSLKKGSGGGNYTNATTSYTVADSTNLCLTVTIPSGWKLGIVASGSLGTSTAIADSFAAVTDNASCSTANSGILAEAQVDAGTIAGFGGFTLNSVITGNGAAHSIALQFRTSNVADTANLLNSTATLTPTMSFTLMPSN